MAPTDVPSSRITRRGFRDYYTDDDGATWVRRTGTDDAWQAYTSDSPYVAPTSKPSLSLALERQVGKRDHWLLYVAVENMPGSVYQVVGDHEIMRYDTQVDVDVTRSDMYRTSYILAGELDDSQQAKVKQVADGEPPPRADSLREVKETCRGWVMRVVRRLVQEGIVGAEKVEMLDGLVTGEGQPTGGADGKP